LNERTAQNFPARERILLIAGATTPAFFSSVDVGIHRQQCATGVDASTATPAIPPGTPKVLSPRVRPTTSTLIADAIENRASGCSV